MGTALYTNWQKRDWKNEKEMIFSENQNIPE